MTARKRNAPCSVPGCERKELARGWCVMHYSRWRTHGEPGEADMRRAPNQAADARCAVEGCPTKVHARGWCPAHLGRWRLYGDPLGSAEVKPPKTIEQLRRDAYEGTPGGTLSSNGYRYRGMSRGRTFAEHRLVMEHIIGRALYADETVHHRNGERSDNRPANLELWSSWQPAGQRVEDKIAWARDLLARYA